MKSFKVIDSICKSDLTTYFQVVAVFGSMHMGASRIVNLQRHRIAQCRSIVIRILGDEGVPVQVDGEAWLHPPGIIRIVHKNRVQLICRDKVTFPLYLSRQLFQLPFPDSFSRDFPSNFSI